MTLALREILVRGEIDRAFRLQGSILSGLETPFAGPRRSGTPTPK